MKEERVDSFVNPNLSKSKKMIQLYNKGLELKEIAEIVGTRYNFVYNVISNYCRMNDLKLRTKNQNSKKQKIIQLIEEGKSNVEICEETKCCYNYVVATRKAYELAPHDSLCSRTGRSESTKDARATCSFNGDGTTTQKDWLFTDEDFICGFRSAGVLIKDGKLFVQREKDGLEYALPGGHVKIGESSAEALIREYKEETGTDIVCRRLIWTEESFWEWSQKRAHTITFYYLIDLCGGEDISDHGEFVSQKDNCDIVFGWIPLDTLKEQTIYPSFLKEKICRIENHIEHFITR